jgi:hypothetical protein
MRLAPYAITAVLALCAGAGASAGTRLVTSEQVRDRTLRPKDFAPKARRALRRSRGPGGARGPRGTRGEPGPPGPIAASHHGGPSETASLVAAGPVAASGTEYLEIGGHGTTTTEADAQLVLPMSSGQITGMRARVAQVGSGLRQFRLRVNESDVIPPGGAAEFVCSIQPGARSCTAPVTFQADVRAGDRVSVQVVGASSPATEATVIFEIRAG